MPDELAFAVPTPVIELSHVSRAHSSGRTSISALDDCTLSVARGEAVAVMGPSGSGKTTMLNLVAGLDRPSTGTVRVFDTVVSVASERELTAFRARHLGLVFQESLLLPGLTALDNVVMARLPWRRRRVLEPEARGLLTSVGLADRMYHTPARLSGGECQRVSIARALLGGPELLLADEPTGNLDATTTDEILDLLAQLRSELSLTLLVATHDPAVAGLADRVVRLVAGRVVDERSSADSGQVEVHEIT